MNLNIVLPDEVYAYLKAQVSVGAYGSVDEYFLDLIQQDQKRKAQEKLEEMLLEGINSDVQEVTPDYWQTLKQSVLGTPEA